MIASSHASAATPPAITPPRRAPSTVFAARALRVSSGPGVSRSAAMELMAPRYRAPPSRSRGAIPRISRRDGHPLLFTREALLGRDLEVHRVREVGLARRELEQRVGEADGAGQRVTEGEARIREDVDPLAVDQADQGQRRAD